MTKKSFFERLTGATKEELFQSKIKDHAENEVTKIKPVKKTQKLAEPEEKPKKLAEQPDIPALNEEWSSEEEGQLTLDVYQTDTDVVIKSTIAGVKPEDLDISITNDMITIKGTRRKDESVAKDNYYYQELYWGAFSRAVILPVDVDGDKAKASIKNGVLTIRLPKIEKLKTKTIKIRELE